MAIKRKTINIKKVKLIKPTYTKPVPHRISSFFTEPVRVPVEDINITKKRKNIPTQKIKKAKQPKPVHKGPLILTKKSIQKLRPKEKPKKKRKAKTKKVAKISTFDSAFPSTPVEPVQDAQPFSDDIVDWIHARNSIVNQFKEEIYSMVSFFTNTRWKKNNPYKIGADYTIKEFINIPGIDNDDLLADFLIENPVHECFTVEVLYDAGMYFLTNGKRGSVFEVDKGIEHYANIISGILMAEMADGDYMEEY